VEQCIRRARWEREQLVRRRLPPAGRSSAPREARASTSASWSSVSANAMCRIGLEDLDLDVSSIPLAAGRPSRPRPSCSPSFCGRKGKCTYDLACCGLVYYRGGAFECAGFGLTGGLAHPDGIRGNSWRPVRVRLRRRGDRTRAVRLAGGDDSDGAADSPWVQGWCWPGSWGARSTAKSIPPARSGTGSGWLRDRRSADPGSPAT